MLKLFKKKQALVAIDVGSTAIKVVEFQLGGEKPTFVNAAYLPLAADVFTNNMISRGETVAEALSDLSTKTNIDARLVITAIPGPSVFTKRIKMPIMPPVELKPAIELEAANFIPHNIEAVRLDFHIIGESSKGQYDVLVVATKSEVIESYQAAFSIAGYQVAVVDVDYFALQNVFELNYPEMTAKTVALINLGARYSAITICRNGDCLFCGDLSLGGRSLSEAITQGLQVSAAEAEDLKRGLKKPKDAAAYNEIVTSNSEYIAAELSRQLSFFWNTSGADEGIDAIFLAGGPSATSGLQEKLAERTGIPCEMIDCLRNVEVSGEVPDSFAQEKQAFAIAAGLATRAPGDKEYPELE